MKEDKEFQYLKFLEAKSLFFIKELGKVDIVNNSSILQYWGG